MLHQTTKEHDNTRVQPSTTFNDILHYAKESRLDFIPDSKNMHFILYVANKTNRDMQSWNVALNQTTDLDSVRIQSIATAVYAAWARNDMGTMEDKNNVEKCLDIGALACAIKEEKTNNGLKIKEHSILFEAQRSYAKQLEQIDEYIKNPPAILRTCTFVEREEIIRTLMFNPTLMNPIHHEHAIKALLKTLDKSLSADHHLQPRQKQRSIVRGVIQHHVEQQHVNPHKEVAAIQPDHAQHLHQMEHQKMQQALQMTHTHMQHIERQLERQRQHNRGLEL